MSQTVEREVLALLANNKMKAKLEYLIEGALQNLGIEPDAIVLEHPAEMVHGDYSTNVALAYAKKAGKNPRALAEALVVEIEKKPESFISKIEVAGPGFINFKLSQDFFSNSVADIFKDGKKWGTNNLASGKKIMVEYTDPNPFKPFHIGHLMTNAIGESVARIFEYSHAEVVRANYQGDVGLHVAKAIWALLKNGKGDESLSVEAQANYIGVCYSEGSNAYDNDPAIKAEIDEINKKVYERSDDAINELYDWGRKVTLEAFETIYKTLGTKFKENCYFFESVMAPLGLATVKDNMGSVFEDSDGAVVFHAEKYNPKLHTRVFVNSKGLPTYETKEIGLTMTKFKQENPDTSIVVTAIEQGEYMKVVQQAIALIHKDYESRMKHITHGMMRFASGKMSSRKGNVITGESLLQDTRDVVYEKMSDRDLSDALRASIAAQVSVAAIKYSILKQALGGDIIYDTEKSISFEGDSGPYLQYTVVRAQALLSKANAESVPARAQAPQDWQTTNLEKYLYRFPEVVERSYYELEPHHIATYLMELASFFNTFYASGKIVDASDESSSYKIALVEAFVITMKNGLYCLGIETPDKM